MKGNVLKLKETMSSRDIAELTGKRHPDVMRDIRNIIKHLDSDANYFEIVNSFYIDSQNRKRPMYVFNKSFEEFIIQKYNGMNRIPHRLQEESALKTIEQLLGITLIRQFKVGKYRIDGYNSINNVAYEIDEPEHIYSVKKDGERENAIKKIINGVVFKRIKL